MATLTVTQVTPAGVAETLTAAAAGGDEFPNNGRVFLVIANGGGGSITATVTTPKTVGGLAVADQAITVGAGARVVAGPFDRDTFNNPANGRVAVTYSGVASVTVGAFRL